MEPVAYGLLALKPWELERLQPYEFLLMVEGAIWRKQRQEDIMAYFVTPLININLDKKHQISPQALIAPLRGDSEERARAEKQHFKDAFGLD